jgi:HEAT repeat protein
MRFLRPPAIIAALLIIAVSIPPPLFSQQRPRSADALAAAINELLKLKPLPPRPPDESVSAGNAFEDEDKPPADDAPVGELVIYWRHNAHNFSDDPNGLKPSPIVRRRLLEACEDRPELLFHLMGCLPEGSDTHDRLYKLLNDEEEPQGEERWKDHLQIWLQRNSAYFRDELIKTAREAGDDKHADEGYLYSPVEDLCALARLDWNAAKPILEKLASSGKAYEKPVALDLLYEHAAREGDSARTESYRALLKAIVGNRQADLIARENALESLMNSEWSGQEEWFIALFADPTLSGFQGDENDFAARSPVRFDTSLYRDTFIRRNADRWLPVISGLVGANHRTVHKAAVKFLVKFLSSESGAEEKKKEIAQKLIPWLTEPNWAAREGRAEFINILPSLNMPELAPEWLWILDNDEDTGARAAAAVALAQYRDPLVLPALRRALEKDEANRETIVTAMAECGSLSDDEMALGVEAYARKVANMDVAQIVTRVNETDKSLPPEAQVSLGRVLSEYILYGRGMIKTTEGLAVRLLERTKALRETEPAVARQILRVIEAAPLRAVEVHLVERIGEGGADFNTVARSLETRNALRKSAGGELYGLVNRGGYAAGVAAAILKDEREWKAALTGRDAKAQLALLACARYLRDKLPVELVDRLLDSPNRALAKAAESYLEVEDSPEARKIILARHPGEAYILGDITTGSHDQYTEAARSWEDALRKEILGRSDVEAIYAALEMGKTAKDFSGVIIRVRGGKAEMSVHEIEGRRDVRRLTESEFEELKSFTSRQEIEGLGPESHFREPLYKCEYLRLTKEGGRRIALGDLRRAPKNPTPHEELSGLFYRLSRSGEFTARYSIEDKIPGLEVVFADKKHYVLSVCGEGSEIRALIEEKGAEYRQGVVKETPKWREFSSGKPGELRDESSACHIFNMPSSAPKDARVIPFGQSAQSDGTLFYAIDGANGGIWKAEPGMDPVKIISGDYNPSVITPDGKWLAAIKRAIGNENTAYHLIRRNLRSGEEFVVPSTLSKYSYQLAYVAAHGKILVLSTDYDGKVWSVNESYLLDPETGTVQPVKGEFRPLIYLGWRLPQSAGAPNLFWTTIFDPEKSAVKFGRYDSKNFVFTPMLEFPELILTRDDIWVNEDGGKIWFTYKGHLLRLPMPAQMK